MGILRRPRNFNAVTVKIAELVRTGPTIDPVFKTAVNVKIRKIVRTYRAQVNLGNKEQDRKVRTTSGDRPATEGHLVLRTIDLAPNTSLPKPEKGWQIIELFADTDQAQTVDYLIEEVRHESQLRGRPLLIYCPFEHNRDRSRKDPA